MRKDKRTKQATKNGRDILKTWKTMDKVDMGVTSKPKVLRKYLKKNTALCKDLNKKDETEP